MALDPPHPHPTQWWMISWLLLCSIVVTFLVVLPWSVWEMSQSMICIITSSSLVVVSKELIIVSPREACWQLVLVIGDEVVSILCHQLYFVGSSSLVIGELSWLPLCIIRVTLLRFNWCWREHFQVQSLRVLFKDVPLDPIFDFVKEMSLFSRL